MPTNANTFNSRVTSEALEAKFRQVFPSQGGAELPQDLFASGVITPVVDFSTVAEGSVLAPNLQTAWDFSTGYTSVNNATTTIISTTGFWKIDLSYATFANNQTAQIKINDGLGTKVVWSSRTPSSGSSNTQLMQQDTFVVFVRAGDSVQAQCTASTGARLDVWYRQIADVNGNLVNPLGFTFS